MNGPELSQSNIGIFIRGPSLGPSVLDYHPPPLNFHDASTLAASGEVISIDP